MGRADESSTNPTLLGRLKSNPRDEAAWSEFVARYYLCAQAWARRRLGSADDADDVAQNVFVTLLEAMQRFQYDAERVGGFRAWLRTVVQNAANDLYNARRRNGNPWSAEVQEFLARAESADELSVHFEREYERELLEKASALVRLDVEPHTWEAYRLSAEGLAATEVATTLGIEVSTVYHAKSRVIRRLQEKCRILDQMD